MFNLFRKKSPSVKIIDQVWMSADAKWKAIEKEVNKNNPLAFIFWFDETLQRAESGLTNQAGNYTLLTAREATQAHIAGKKVIIAEHYPMQQKENELHLKLGLNEVTYWSALDEPLFLRFGGEKIIQLMKQLGMKEEEAVEHAMISKSIRNAQEKIAAKVSFEQSSRSQKEWIEKNLRD